MLGGVCSHANYIAVYEDTNKTESPIFVLLYVLVSKGNLLDLFYFIAAGVKCRIGAVKRLLYFTIVHIIFLLADLSRRR